MSQTAAIVQALKQVLKYQQLTYADIARELQVSEASIKRQFSLGRFTLERLEEIAELAGFTLLELTTKADARPAAITELTETQEQELLTDEKLLLVTFLVLNGWAIEQIIQRFNVTEVEVIQRLARLDRLGMIDLLANNRVRRRVARNFFWRKNGPVEQYFSQEIQKDFLDSRFSATDEHHRFAGVLMSRHSVLKMHQIIDQAVRQIDELCEADLTLPLDEKVSVGAVFAIRPWEAPVFKRLKQADE